VTILIADDLPVSAVDLLRAVDGWRIDVCAGRPRAEILEKVEEADALIVRSATKVDAELLGRAARLRVVARAGTGVDNVDLEAASARGIVVMNAPGANSVSVAEHACALMLALARSISVADAGMKQGRWEKKRLMGEEIRGKTLGVVGLGRIGQEVVGRARAFGMNIVAHDPFISTQVAADLDVPLLSLDELFATADYVTLHVPATAATRRMIDAPRLAKVKRGLRIINTARGDLIDEDALADAIEAGQVGGAGLDVFQVEPTTNRRLASLPQVIATPHIAASTVEAQEMVGLEAAASVRDFLRDGVVRNAVNFPSIGADEYRRLQPFAMLAQRLAGFAAQLAAGRTEGLGIRYYGELTGSSNELLASAALVGLFKTILETTVTPVNARAVARQRGVEIVESHSSRRRNFTSLLSIKVLTNEGECWVEGTVFETGSPRLVFLDGVDVEAPLEGTQIVIRNVDMPGVIGEVGTILGRHDVNIANFALGRNQNGAVGVVSVDEPSAEEGVRGRVTQQVLDELRGVKAVRDARVVRV
jgi:D-3-phosphoglycerate dehydrogenase